MARYVVAAASEIPPGGRKLLTVAGREIGVFNHAGEYFALLNRCPHQGGELCRGKLIGLVTSRKPGTFAVSRPGEILKCPWHGWEFDLRTGRSWCDPDKTRVRTYPATVEPGASVTDGSLLAKTFPVVIECDYVVVDL
jgi:nitrite reductase/ring-hydroxylating ferredoxin subunit